MFDVETQRPPTHGRFSDRHEQLVQHLRGQQRVFEEEQLFTGRPRHLRALPADRYPPQHVLQWVSWVDSTGP